MGLECFEIADAWRAVLGPNSLRGLSEVFAFDRGDRLDKPGLEPWRQRWRMRLVDGEGCPRTLFLKRFDRPPLRRQWERWRSGEIRSATAAVEWRNARALAAVGVRAAEPVAFGQRMLGPLEIRSAIILGEAPGESLERWVPANVVPAARERDWPARRRFLDGLARFVARFHANGFVHRDLYLCHIFHLPAAAPDAEVASDDSFCLIDLQRVFRPRWRGRRWVVKDLAALNFSAPRDLIGDRERLRFLCRYGRICSRYGSARQLAGPVLSRTDRMRRRAARRVGEPA